MRIYACRVLVFCSCIEPPIDNISYSSSELFYHADHSLFHSKMSHESFSARPLELVRYSSEDGKFIVGKEAIDVLRGVSRSCLYPSSSNTHAILSNRSMHH